MTTPQNPFQTHANKPARSLSGLQVTPEIFLAYHLRMKKGEKLDFSPADLEVALKAYVNKFGDHAMHDALKAAKTPLEFALQHVRAAQKTKPKFQPRTPQANAAQKQAQAFLASHGLTQKATPAAAREHSAEDGPAQGDHVPDDAPGLEELYEAPDALQEDLLQMAAKGTHREAYEAIGLAVALGGSQPLVSKAGAAILLDKYTTGTEQERALCLSGIDSTINDGQRKELQHRLDQVIINEQDGALRAMAMRVAGYKDMPVDVPEAATPKNAAEHHMRDFKDNKTVISASRRSAVPNNTTAIHTPQRHVRSPGLAAPKPNFNDPAFSGAKRDES